MARPSDDKPFSWYDILQLAVVHHPSALVGGILQSLTPGAGPLRYGGDHSSRVPDEVDDLYLCVFDPGLQPGSPQPDGLDHPW